MASQKVHFDNFRGEKLVARLDLPVDDAPRAFALFAHCFTCSKNLSAVGHISRALTQEGLAVLRFDFTGLGESEGDFADTNFSSNVEDLLAASAYLERHYEAPSLLIGHSLGGSAVLQAARLLPHSRGVVTIGAPAEAAHVESLLSNHREEIERIGEAEVTLAGRKFKIKKQFLDDLEDHRMSKKVQTLNKDLLVLHAPLDQVVGIDNAARIFERAKHPKSFVSLDRADHLLSRSADSLYVGRVIAAWASRLVKERELETPQREIKDNRVVVRTGAKGYRTDISANGHPLVADEPLSMGGTDLGASPYDLLAASLGACTSMTLRMYADRKGWPLEEIFVNLKHQKIHARDCEACETEHGRVDEIERELTLVGPLDEAQRARLVEIADRCPVHRTLHGEIRVVTRLQA